MIKNLSQREWSMVTGGAVALALLLIIFGVILPYNNAMDRLDKKIASRKAQLQEVRQLQVDYLGLKQQAGRLKRQFAKSGGTSAVSKATRGSAHASRSAAMSPSYRPQSQRRKWTLIGWL